VQRCECSGLDGPSHCCWRAAHHPGGLQLAGGTHLLQGIAEAAAAPQQAAAAAAAAAGGSEASDLAHAVPCCLHWAALGRTLEPWLLGLCGLLLLLLLLLLHKGGGRGEGAPGDARALAGRAQLGGVVREEADLALAVGALLAQRSVIPAERAHGRAISTPCNRWRRLPLARAVQRLPNPKAQVLRTYIHSCVGGAAGETNRQNLHRVGQLGITVACRRPKPLCKAKAQAASPSLGIENQGHGSLLFESRDWPTHRSLCSQYSKSLCAKGQLSPRPHLPSCFMFGQAMAVYLYVRGHRRRAFSPACAKGQMLHRTRFRNPNQQALGWRLQRFLPRKQQPFLRAPPLAPLAALPGKSRPNTCSRRCLIWGGAYLQSWGLRLGQGATCGARALGCRA
jgi:hypothetical protein